MIDMHSHILPGLDDGARSMEESLEMARTAVREGIAAIVCTPHALKNYDELAGLAEEKRILLRQELDANGIPLKLLRGFEVFVNERILDYENLTKLTLSGDNSMLIEFDFGRLPDCLDEVLYLLDISGITPVIAHPERYEYFQKDIAGLKQLKEKGALLQVNASSISGIHGGKAQKAAKKILKQQLADVIGTDAHSPGVRGEYMDEALRLADKWSRTDYKNKFAENARYLLGEEGKDIV